MNSLNVKKGDNVKVLAGKDKGKTGKVLATDPKTGKVLVEGVNMATRHLKTRSANDQGGKKTVEAPLDVSNVQIVCPSCSNAVRVRHQVTDGKNVRICAKCGASLDVAAKPEKAKKKADKAEKKTAADKPKKTTKKTKTTEAKAEEKVPVEETSDGKTE